MSEINEPLEACDIWYKDRIETGFTQKYKQGEGEGLYVSN